MWIISRNLNRTFLEHSVPTIAKLFRYVGIAENAGYGMKKLTSWEALTGVRPTIESDRTIATVTFPLKSAIQRLNVSDVPVNVPVKLTDTQQKVLQLIRNNPSITHFEMSQKLSINEKTAKRATQALRDIGLITREGNDKNGIWKLL